MKFINLKRFRKERGLTQNQLGETLKVPQSTISYLENGLQEVTDSLLECIKTTFSVDDIEGYVYERNNFHESERSPHIREEELFRIFNMDWDYANPTDILDGLPIVCKTGLINIAKDGTIVIDRNIGIGFRLDYYVIPPKQFIREVLKIQFIISE